MFHVLLTDAMLRVNDEVEEAFFLQTDCTLAPVKLFCAVEVDA